MGRFGHQLRDQSDQYTGGINVDGLVSVDGYTWRKTTFNQDSDSGAATSWCAEGDGYWTPRTARFFGRWPDYPTVTSDLDHAAEAIRDGELVVYPTETVYGLGADALDRGAVERVFAAKGRDRDNPVSLGVPSVETALAYTEPTDRERRFMREFLPGPVTVLVRKTDAVPDVLTAGRDRVGVRIPDHELALALLDRVAPITATSANVSGRPSVRRVADLDSEIREAAAAILDGGETPGTESTVVDVASGEIVRRGALADRIESWLQAEE